MNSLFTPDLSIKYDVIIISIFYREQAAKMCDKKSKTFYNISTLAFVRYAHLTMLNAHLPDYNTISNISAKFVTSHDMNVLYLVSRKINF